MNDLEDLSREDKKQYNLFIKMAKTAETEGRPNEALVFFQRALRLYSHPKLEKKIGTLRDSIQRDKENAWSDQPSTKDSAPRPKKVLQKRSEVPKKPSRVIVDDDEDEDGNTEQRQDQQQEQSYRQQERDDENDFRPAKSALVPSRELQVPKRGPKTADQVFGNVKSLAALTKLREIVSDTSKGKWTPRSQDGFSSWSSSDPNFLPDISLCRIDCPRGLICQSDMEDIPDDVRGGLLLPSALYQGLFGYQREGVKWLWTLFCSSKMSLQMATSKTVEELAHIASSGAGADAINLKENEKTRTSLTRTVCGDERGGGILGDDMGLGKTVQVLSFMRLMVQQRFMKRVLIVLPLSCISNWLNEAEKWLGDGLFRDDPATPPSGLESISVLPRHLKIHVLHRSSKKARITALKEVALNGGICVTTYGMVVSCLHLLANDLTDETNADLLDGSYDLGDDEDDDEEEDDEGQAGGASKKKKKKAKKPGRKKNSNKKQYDPQGRTMIRWDFCVLDEGHKIKNPSTKIAKAVRALDCGQRLLLTGTPIQNNLREMWALMDWTCHGRLLGPLPHFKNNYETPILLSRDRNATPETIQKGARAVSSMTTMISPFFLRREKAVVFRRLSAPRKSLLLRASPSRSPSSLLGPSSPESGPAINTLKTSKNDFILWVPISPAQEKLYRAFLNTTEVAEILNETKSPLAAISVLKKICNHPRLLNQTKTISELYGPDDSDDLLDVHRDALGLTSSSSSSSSSNKDQESTKKVERDLARIGNIDERDDPEMLVRDSSKIRLLLLLMRRLRREGHRTLIFSLSKVMLSIIETLFRLEGHGLEECEFEEDKKPFKTLRMDGSISDYTERQRLVSTFQQDPSFEAMLLTTQVGGLGINLTSADRVIIIDPAWNDLDDQAVDRAYRIGQKNNVVVYRMITCGTIEEKIYRKQVFKRSLMKTIIKKQSQYRYFTEQELCELFTLADDLNISATQQQLLVLHPPTDRCSYPELEEHIRFLHSEELGLAGTSDNDLLFSKSNPNDLKLFEQLSTTAPVDPSSVMPVQATSHSEPTFQTAPPSHQAPRPRAILPKPSANVVDLSEMPFTAAPRPILPVPPVHSRVDTTHQPLPPRPVESAPAYEPQSLFPDLTVDTPDRFSPGAAPTFPQLSFGDLQEDEASIDFGSTHFGDVHDPENDQHQHQEEVLVDDEDAIVGEIETNGEGEGDNDLNLPVCLRPISSIDEEKGREYNDLLNAASQFEEREDLVTSLCLYTKALCICDEQLELHGKIWQLLHRTNGLNDFLDRLSEYEGGSDDGTA